MPAAYCLLSLSPLPLVLTLTLTLILTSPSPLPSPSHPYPHSSSPVAIDPTVTAVGYLLLPYISQPAITARDRYRCRCRCPCRRFLLVAAAAYPPPRNPSHCLSFFSTVLGVTVSEGAARPTHIAVPSSAHPNVDCNRIRSGCASSASLRSRRQSQVILSNLGPFNTYPNSCREESCFSHPALGLNEPSQSSRRKRVTAEVDLGWKTVAEFVSEQRCEISANPKQGETRHPTPSSHKLQCETWPAAQDHCEEGAAIIPRSPHHLPASTPKTRSVLDDLPEPIHGLVAAVGSSDR